MVVKFSVYLNRRVFVMSTDRSKAVSLLQFFFVRASVVSYMALFCPLRKHAYSDIRKILQPKNENFQIKVLIFLIFLLKT